jgi:hypothetical protein
MTTLDPIAFHAGLDAIFGFVGYEPERPPSVQAARNTPHQSKGRLVRFPGASLAAQELGVSRGHLHRVLTGERKSPPLIHRWHAWLALHPQFASLQPKR